MRGGWVVMGLWETVYNGFLFWGCFLIRFWALERCLLFGVFAGTVFRSF